MSARIEGTVTEVATGEPLEPTTRTGRLTGKVALVTGAAGNLGGHIVRHFLSEGATVVLTGRDRARIDAARTAAVEATGVADARVSAVTLDGANADSVRAAIAETMAKRLWAEGLFLVGLDVIGDKVTEINVTSPTGFVEIAAQTGFDVADLFIRKLETAVKL